MPRVAMLREVAARWRGRRLLALSPHSDDLALSVGGVLPTLAAVAEVTVITVFSRSVWAPQRPELGPSQGEEISRLRIREDRAYCRHLGARLVTLPFADAGVRGYSATTELVAPLAGDPLAATVLATLERLLDQAPMDGLLAPLGLGGHIDHRIVATAALRHPRRLPRFFYEDLPYGAEAPLGARPRVSDTLPAKERRLVPEDLELGEEGLAAKVEGLGFYPSQIRTGERQAVIAHARRRGGAGSPRERLWRWDPSPKLSSRR